ncbi:MAG: HAD family hydrolase [Aggregatilineales bacterium]
MSDTIQLIAVDLDGTLLNSCHELTPRTEAALKAAMARGVQVVLATGKTRASALSVIARLGLTTPGIFSQGLTVYNGDGTLRRQTTLDPAVARRVITFAEDRGFVVIAYAGERLLVRARTRQTAILTDYGEPEPQIIGPLQNILDSVPVNKLVMTANGDVRRVRALRWQLSMQLDGAARLMQANVAQMLELLPPGASKGAALRALLRDLRVDPQRVLAIGDGENDVEMVQLAGVGVAVGNADAHLKAVADHVVATNDSDGVAEAVERFVLASANQPTQQPVSAGEVEKEP